MMKPSSIQLYCFPHAGASAAAYMPWRRRLPPWIEVVPVELAGRGRRLGEPLETTMAGVVAQVESLIRPQAGQRFALFGHSLGALVAFECAQLLAQCRGAVPCALFASGCQAPSHPERNELSEHPTDAELIAELRRVGGTPPAVLECAELMQLALPILRADFQVSASYQRGTEATISAPIHVLAGSHDQIDGAALRGWCAHTRAEFSLRHFAGSHFFIHEREAEVLEALVQTLAPWRESDSARRRTQVDAHAAGRFE